MWALRPPGRNCGSKDTQHSCRYQSGKGESHDITLSFLSLLSRTLRNLSLNRHCLVVWECLYPSQPYHHYPSLHQTRQQLVIGHIMLAPCLVTSKASRELHSVSSPGLLPRSKTVTTTDLLNNFTIQVHAGSP